MQYSRYSSFNQITRDETSSAQALCARNLEKDFFNKTNVKLNLAISIIVIPAIATMAILAALWVNINVIERKYKFLSKPDY